jgi:NAD(P)H-flavin reductase
MRITFSSGKEIRFLPGQFLSLYVPDQKNPGKFLRRAYSFSAPPAEIGLYELCVKHQPGGAGTEFLAALKPGGDFSITAPYGHFLYQAPAPGRYVCFISTSTGVGPFRSMVLSEQFRENPPERCFFLLGAKLEKEILFPGEFEALDLLTVHAVSQPGPGYSGFRGRVTDYLRSLPVSWHWHDTDFYICGNPDMVQEVREILKGGHGVPDSSIACESFFHARAKEDAAA